MNENNGDLACEASEPHIQTFPRQNLYWNLLEFYGEKSIVCTLQLYTNNSQTRLGRHSFLFYFLHLTLLRFPEKWRTAHIMKGKKTGAYFSVRKDTETRRLGNVSVECDGHIITIRLFSLHVLYTCIAKTMEPLAEVASWGFQATTSDGLRLRVHLMIASYVSDLPEIESLLSLKREACTRLPFYRYLIYREDLANAIFGTPRTLCDTMDVMTKMTEAVRKQNFSFNCHRIRYFHCSETSQLLKYTGVLTYIDFSRTNEGISF